MNNILDFTNMYPVSKTLRWSLKPIGATKHFIDENSILETDRKKAETYERAKILLDEVYKDFINAALKDMEYDDKNYSSGDYYDLANALDDFQKDKIANRDLLYKAAAICRNKIVAHMKNANDSSAFVGAGKAKEILSYAYKKDSDNTLKSVFERFSGYFNGYCENRANLFSSEAKASSLAYRIVDENFPKFHRNTKTLERIKELHADLYAEIVQILAKNYDVNNPEVFFSNERYCDYMVQSGIDRYNLVIGGKTLEDGTKIQGLNELVNLYCQKKPEIKRRDFLFIPLFKQLMEERIRESFIPHQCESDSELIEVVGRTESEISHIHSLLSVISNLKDYDIERVFISNKEVSLLSIYFFGPGKWNSLFNSMIEMKKNEIISNSQKGSFTKQQLKIIETIPNQDFFSIQYLESVLEYAKENANIIEEKRADNILRAISICSKLLSNTISTTLKAYKEKDVPNSIREDASFLGSLKSYLDSLIESARFIKSFIPTADYESDPVFNESFIGVEELYRTVVRTYDFARNYAAKEVPAERKFKLNFNCPTLANGWDRNKERDNLCVILRKDGKYYLAIRNKMDDSSVLINSENCKPEDNDTVYEKMVYKYLPSPSKMLPKVFFSKSGQNLPYGPNAALIKAYTAKKRGDVSYYEEGFGTEKNYTTALINYYIGAIPQYGDWVEFGMAFKKPESYESLNDFYKDVERQNYFVSFENVSSKKIEEMVASGKVFLFQIYNKDYAPMSQGQKNLHTMYWEYLFSTDNLAKTHTIKLNGEAELFFRPANKGATSLTHPTGSYLVNRNTRDGKHIPDKCFKEIYEYANGRLKTLSEEAKVWYGSAIIKKARFDLIKGKRFTEDQFSFHVPITINYNADSSTDINSETCRMLINNSDCNIIGIDRGERNLIYISVVNQNGDLLYQKSLNQVPGSNNIEVDYLSKLADAEIARDEARKSWGTIGKIADLKEGYLSTVVSLVTDLMVKYNAIVVLENLNTVFKRGRFKIERQVYQKFEAALINKMGLIVSKNVQEGKPRSIPCALQLANRFESFEKIGSQTGWLFYVPAAYTSKIDPITGFSNVFNFKNLTNFEKKLDFFGKFKCIKYDTQESDFKFTFSYGDFDCLVNQNKGRTWILSSRGERIIHDKDGSTIRERPTDELESLLAAASIEYKDEKNLISKLVSLPRTNANIAFMDKFYRVFTHILQMRNSCNATGDDYIISPVKNNDGYYDSRNYAPDSKYPCDADANGAYNIARKGIVLINKLRNDPENYRSALKISNEEWFAFAQG